MKLVANSAGVRNEPPPEGGRKRRDDEIARLHQDNREMPNHTEVQAGENQNGEGPPSWRDYSWGAEEEYIYRSSVFNQARF